MAAPLGTNAGAFAVCVGVQPLRVSSIAALWGTQRNEINDVRPTRPPSALLPSHERVTVTVCATARVVSRSTSSVSGSMQSMVTCPAKRGSSATSKLFQSC